MPATAVRLTGAVALVALLAACAAPAPAEEPPAGPPAGNADPVVVALDEFAAANALSLGIEPDLALDVFGYATTAAVLADAGVPTEPYGAELSLEQILGAQPDLIIGVSIPSTAAREAELVRIAPTTVLDYTDTWQEQLAATAAALGVPERASALRVRIEADAADLATDLAAAGLAGAPVSVLGHLEGTFSPPPATAAGAVLADAGLTRPAAQQQTGTPDSPFVSIADETLLGHDADTVYLLGGSQYSPGPLIANPLWPRLIDASQVYEVSGETWLGSSAFTVDWILRDLRATLLDGDQPATDADAVARFRAFAAAD